MPTRFFRLRSGAGLLSLSALDGEHVLLDWPGPFTLQRPRTCWLPFRRARARPIRISIVRSAPLNGSSGYGFFQSEAGAPTPAISSPDFFSFLLTNSGPGAFLPRNEKWTVPARCHPLAPRVAATQSPAPHRPPRHRPLVDTNTLLGFYKGCRGAGRYCSGLHSHLWSWI